MAGTTVQKRNERNRGTERRMKTQCADPKYRKDQRSRKDEDKIVVSSNSEGSDRGRNWPIE